MLRLKKYPSRSPYWQIRGSVAGIVISESTGTVDRGQAEEYRRKREAEIYAEVKLGQVRPATFADAITAYRQGGRGGRFLMPLLDHFKETPLADIGQIEVDKAAAALYPTAKASTLNRQVYGPVIAVLRYAAAARMPGATVPMIKHRKAQKPVISPADDEHIAKLLPHCSDGLKALILLMTYTGLRTGEALRVKPEDVKGGYVHVGKTKNGQPRMVPVPDGWRYPDSGFGFQTTQGVGRALRRAHERAGLVRRDGHEIGRHAFAARWLRNGGSIKALKEAGGWESMRVLEQHYGHLEMSAVHDFMRSLSVQKPAKAKADDE